MVRDSIVQWQKLMGISGDADITEYKKGSCCDTSSIGKALAKLSCLSYPLMEMPKIEPSVGMRYEGAQEFIDKGVEGTVPVNLRSQLEFALSISMDEYHRRYIDNSEHMDADRYRHLIQIPPPNPVKIDPIHIDVNYVEFKKEADRTPAPHWTDKLLTTIKMGYYIEVLSEQHGKAVQDRARELGFEFDSAKGKVIETLKYIHLNTENKRMSHSNVDHADTFDKKTLDDLYLMKDKVSIEPGKWFKNGDNIFYYLEDDADGVKVVYGFLNGWSNKVRFVSSTDTWEDVDMLEVTNALVEEAKRRGFGEGAMYRDISGDNVHTSVLTGRFEPSAVYNGGMFGAGTKPKFRGIEIGDGYIFKDGVWAENLGTTLEINSYKLEKADDEDHIKFGCITFKKKSVKKLYKLMDQMNITAIELDSEQDVTRGDVKRVINYMENN